MPTLSVFYGIVIQMFWRSIRLRIFMRFTVNTKFKSIYAT